MPKDYLGQVIETGDTIVYPGRQGSSMWLNTAEVLAISWAEAEGPKVKYTLSIVRSDGRRAQITQLNRVIVVEKKNATV
jgi:hypothetical protein